MNSSRWTGTWTHTRKQNQNISTDTAILLNQKRANVPEHTTKMASLEFLKGATRRLWEEWMEGNIKGDYLRLMPGLCLEDRMNWYASSRWWRVIWLVHSNRNMCSIKVIKYVFTASQCQWAITVLQSCKRMFLGRNIFLWLSCSGSLKYCSYH